MTILSAQDIHVSFGGIKVLDGVSLSLKRGGLTGLIGTNGAGKSTLFSVICGLIRPDSGKVMFNDEDVHAAPDYTRAHRGLVRTFQVPREFSHLSVLENILAAGKNQPGENLLDVFFRPRLVRHHEETLRERAEGILQFLNLSKVAGENAGRLSGGQKKLLELGRLLMLEPTCILLDEPFAGVNPVLIQELAERITDLNTRGISILIIEHNLHALSRLVSDMYVMDRGQILAHGNPNTLLEDESVRMAYMGGVV
ncbi:ATP-binding cassette domain-containing protein [Pusillimonas sp. TS35]|nr:ATP-binding cassette domain-containing protein [Pusillimonas sp. TS35]